MAHTGISKGHKVAEINSELKRVGAQSPYNESEATSQVYAYITDGINRNCTSMSPKHACVRQENG
jgi:hypothetical protein